jgi:hypothetical protein
MPRLIPSRLDVDELALAVLGDQEAIDRNGIPGGGMEKLLFYLGESGYAVLLERLPARHVGQERDICFC